jgi:peptidoglycan/LPS O-acetylase OafA/YrhL
MTSNSVMAKVGQTSYSTYLIHIPLFAVSAYGFSRVLGRWDQDVVLMSTATAMLFLLPLGTFLYVYVEKPFIRWGALLTKPPVVAATAI